MARQAAAGKNSHFPSQNSSATEILPKEAFTLNSGERRWKGFPQNTIPDRVAPQQGRLSC